MRRPTGATVVVETVAHEQNNKNYKENKAVSKQEKKREPSGHSIYKILSYIIRSGISPEAFL